MPAAINAQAFWSAVVVASSSVTPAAVRHALRPWNVTQTSQLLFKD